MRKITVVLSIMFLASLCVFSGCTGGSGEAEGVIKIGVIGPMNFTQGEGHWNGAVMAADEVNADGGVKVGDKRMKIELVKADSNEFISLTDATNAMERLCVADKVDFIVGGFRTEAVLAMQDIAMDNKIIFLGCGAADNKLCDRVAEDYERYKYWFRVTPFKSSLLGQSAFIQLKSAADILKERLGIEKPKVAIVMEKQAWVDKILAASKVIIPNMGMEVVGVWQPSQTATDVSAELSAIQRAGADIIFTAFSAAVGVTFVKQANELEIPAFIVGINVEASKDSYHEATGGHSDYVFVMATYAKNVEITKNTKHFVHGYIERFGSLPPYTADTYSAIKIILAPSIEKAGTLEADPVIEQLEQGEFLLPSGLTVYEMDHDIRWGAGYQTSIACQWQNGEFLGVWPNKTVIEEGKDPVTYKGVVSVKLPPPLVEKYKK